MQTQRLPVAQEKTTSRLALACPVLLVALVLVTFGQVLDHDLLSWDDTVFITENPYAATPVFKQMGAAWRSAYAGLYVPLTHNLWALVAVLARWLGQNSETGMHPAPFHAISLIVHSANSVLVAMLLRRLTTGNSFALLAGAAVFALHPIQIEAVNWASALKDLLSAFLLLLTIHSYLSSDGGARNSRAWYLLSLLLAWFAMLAKPGAVIVGPALFAIDWLLRGRDPRTTLRRVAPFLAVAILPILWTRTAQPADGIDFTPWQFRPQIAAYVFCGYLKHVLWPMGKAIDYGMPSHEVMFTIRPVICCVLLALAGLVLLVVRVQARRHLLGVALLFAVGIMPVLGFFPYDFQRFSAIADHYAYFPMLAVAILTVGIIQLVGRYGLPIGAAMIVLLGIATINQQQYWYNDHTLTRRALEINPDSPVGATNLAVPCPLSPMRGMVVPYEPLARKAVLREIGSTVAMNQMAVIAETRGDIASVIWYNDQIIRRKIMSPHDPRDTALRAVRQARLAVTIGDTLRAKRALALAEQFRPDLPSIKEVRRELELLTSKPAANIDTGPQTRPTDDPQRQAAP